jgi:chromosome condensin MukBEF ATPase and DNA-binding subunit MukB
MTNLTAQTALDARLQQVKAELDDVKRQLADLQTALLTSQSATFREAARLLEDTGRDDDAVNLLDNVADGILSYAPNQAING